MNCKHPRRLTIRFPSTSASITFEIEETGVPGFLPLITNYLEFCIKNDAFGKVSKNVIDSETYEPFLLVLDIFGSIPVCVGQLKAIIPQLLEHSKQVKP